MKAFPALRCWAVAALITLCFAPHSPAQLFHIVSKDSFPGVDSWNNTGVAVNAKFEFNYGGTVGLLRLTLTNLGGTARPLSEGGGTYTSGILTQFGFDRSTGLSLVSGSYSQALASGSGSEPSGINFVLDVGQDIGSWNFDFGADSSSEVKGLSGGYSAVFNFKFTGTASALSKFNSAGFFANNGTDSDMGFRFDNVGPGCDSDYDKFAFWVDDTSNTPIPEPSTYGMMAAGLLLGVVGFKRYRAARKG